MMERPTKSDGLSKPLCSDSTPIITTLYELIEAVSEEIMPGEEHWISLIVDHLLSSGREIQSDKNKEYV